MMKFAAAAVLAAMSAGCSPKEFELAGNGRSASIVIPADALESTKLAAKELAEYVGKATGITPTVSTGAAAGAAAVMIGTVDRMKNLPPEVAQRLAAMKQDEAAWTGISGGKLWIVGKSETAELYAVYHFLESRLGVRWFQAPVKEDPGEYVPRTNRLAFAEFSLYREPAFAVRRLDGTGVAISPIPVAGMATAVRNGYQVHPLYGQRVRYAETNTPLYRFFAPRVNRRYQSLGGGHLTFVNPMPGPKAFKKHPEWFALVDGKRVQGATHMEQYCLSNPEVRQNVVDYILRQLRETGGLGQYLFGQIDSPHGGCECEKCRALDGPGEDPVGGRPSRTTRFVKTINDIAAKVWEKYPQADLRMWAYLDYRELPQGVKPDARFKLYFCPHGRCYGHTLDDPKCERNVKMYNLLMGWRKLLNDVYIYDYLTCTPMEYTCNERQEAHDIAMYQRLGLIGWKNEAAFSGSRFVGGGDFSVKRERFPSSWQWLYASGHLLWDPTLDLDALLDDAESKYYGAAYPAMRKYQKLRRRLWAETPGCMGYPTGDQRRPMLLERAGAKEELLEFLDEAEKLAKDDEILKFRIGRDRKWLDRFWIKPNEEVKAKRGKVIKVPELSGKIKIDGDGSDAAWSGAVFTDQFKVAYLGKNNKPDVNPKLATKAGVAYDGENLYFLLTALEPSVAKMKAAKGPGAAVWDDDGFEIFLFPPSAENRCYHVAVNPAGAVYGGTNPGGRDPAAFGAEAAAKVYDGRYVIEVRIPVRKIAPLVKGEVWRLQIGRNRLVKDDLMPKGGRFSLDGEVYTDTLAFRSMQIGRSYLRNGTFDELNDKGRPKSWSFPNGWTGTSKGPQGVAVKMVPPQVAVQTMWHGELSQKPYPRKLKYAVRASGNGTLKVGFVRYRDTMDPKAKHGYRRECLKPSGVGGTYVLSGKMEDCCGEYEIAADEWCSIAVSCERGNILVESVNVERIGK